VSPLSLSFSISSWLAHPHEQSGTKFVIYEQYAGQDALNKHYASEAFGAMGKAMGEEGLLDVSSKCCGERKRRS